jgi:sugar phosphate isomerase/epimerase
LDVFSENDVKWDQLIRTLNRVGYSGLLSIEWEHTGMDRDWGAPEALEMIRKLKITLHPRLPLPHKEKEINERGN